MNSFILKGILFSFLFVSINTINEFSRLSCFFVTQSKNDIIELNGLPNIQITYKDQSFGVKEDSIPLQIATLPANSPNIVYEGRTFLTQNGIVCQGYPGISTNICFYGNQISMVANASSDELYMDVIIDNAPPFFLKVPKGKNKIILAKDLALSNHSIQLIKRVESCVGILEIESFNINGHILPPPTLPKRKLLFLGDSFTAGQATTVEDGDKINPQKAMRQNARLSYGRILANRLNAQCHVIAYAGRGIVRDWQGITNIACAPDYYELTIPDDIKTGWNHSNYIPDAICVCLGNNDFDVGIPEQVAYINAYTEFIRKLRRDAPDAFIFLITSPSLTDNKDQLPMRTIQKIFLDQVALKFEQSRIKVIQIANYPIVKGDWHPSGTAHRAVADELEPIMKKSMDW